MSENQTTLADSTKAVLKLWAGNARKRFDEHPAQNLVLYGTLIGMLTTVVTGALVYVIIPYYGMFLIIPNFVLLAVYVYAWRRKKNFITGPLIQNICWMQIVWTAFQVTGHFSNGDIYNVLLGCELVVNLIGWFAYAMIAAVETELYISELNLKMYVWINKIYTTIDKVTDVDTGQSNNIGGLIKITANLSNIADLQNTLQKRMLLLTLAEIDKVAEKTAAKLSVEKSELFDRNLLPDELLSPAVKKPSFAAALAYNTT
jgi:hypothetical protein